MTIRLITDSGCDLPQHIIDDFHITRLPLVVTLNGKEYLDQQTIQPSEVYHAIRDGQLPQTAQVPPHLIQEAFESAAQANEPCIYLAFSSGLSGTYQTSELIKRDVLEKYPEATIQIFDTKAASTGLGLLVLHAAEMIKENTDYDQLLTAIQENIDHIEHLFTVKDLEFLVRGGRLSKTSAFVGSLLKVQPILDVEEGRLVQIEKVRGEKKLYQRFLDIMEERGKDLSKQTIAISHGDDLESANRLKAMIQERFGTERVIISIIGSAIGAHSGIGTLAVYFMNHSGR